MAFTLMALAVVCKSSAYRVGKTSFKILYQKSGHLPGMLAVVDQHSSCGSAFYQFGS